MFYIVETPEQLEKVIAYGNTHVFIDIIPVDDRIHPAMNTASLIYFRPLTAKRGFILCIDHLETFSLAYEEVMTSLINKIPIIYTIDKKTLLHYGFPEEAVIGLKMAYTLSGEEPFPELSKFDTPAHSVYDKKLEKRVDINRFIPVSKHYEKYENFFEHLDIVEEYYNDDVFQFYNDAAARVFYQIEKEGICISPQKFDVNFPGYQKRFSIKDYLIYSQYNLYNATARPSCMYNSMNFLGLRKDNGSRNCLIPNNDIFVEFDYNAYQVRILADFLQYDFPESNIHAHLAHVYHGRTDLTEQEYADAKKLTFRYLYGRDPEVPDIEFFQRVYHFRDFLWKQYTREGYIESTITGRKIRGITEITQILPYLMQCIETECNIIVMDKLLSILSNYESKLVLYSYDAFLFDMSSADPPGLINEIQNILEDGTFPTSMSYGSSFGELEKH